LESLLDGNADAGDHPLGVPLLVCSARQMPSPEYAVFSAEVSKHIDVVDESWQPSQRAQVCWSQVSGQIVCFGDVGEQVAVVRVFEKKMRTHPFLAPQPHFLQRFFVLPSLGKLQKLFYKMYMIRKPNL